MNHFLVFTFILFKVDSLLFVINSPQFLAVSDSSSSQLPLGSHFVLLTVDRRICNRLFKGLDIPHSGLIIFYVLF